MGKDWKFSLKIRNNIHSHHFYWTCTGGSSWAIRQEKVIKGIQNEMKQVNLSLFADDIIFYIEDPKEYIHIHTTKLFTSLESLQDTRSIVFLYTSNEHWKQN